MLNLVLSSSLSLSSSSFLLFGDVWFQFLADWRSLKLDDALWNAGELRGRGCWTPESNHPVADIRPPSVNVASPSFFLSLSLSLSIYSTPFSFSFISFFRWCCFSVKYLPKGKRSSELVTALEFEVGGEERGGRREGGRKWRSYYAIGGESMWWRISACLFQCLFVSF